MAVALDEKQNAINDLTERENSLIREREQMQSLICQLEEKTNLMDPVEAISQTGSSRTEELKKLLHEEQQKCEKLKLLLEDERRKSNRSPPDIDSDENRELEMTATGAIPSDREFSPSDEELKMLQERLRSAEERAESLEEQVSDLRKQRDYLQQQVEAEMYKASSRPGGDRSPGIETSMSAEVDDFTEELMKTNRKVYEKEELLKEKDAELIASIKRCTWLEEENRKMGQELWYAKERIANQDREIGGLYAQIEDEKGQKERMRQQMEQEKQRLAETGGVDYSKFEALKTQMAEQEKKLVNERNEAQWYLGEAKHALDEANWRIGELEAGVSHRQWMLDQANEKAFSLQEQLNKLQEFQNIAKEKLNGTFLIRKQPVGERTKWRLAMWTDDSPEDLKQYRRVWFEIAAPGAKVVTLSASFVNWECSLICDKFDEDGSKFGVWVDIPPGRYEFCFVVDGRWTTCDQYAVVTNEFGTMNNWRYID